MDSTPVRQGPPSRTILTRLPNSSRTCLAVVGLTPSGRLGEVSDMADAVVFLASDAARFVNGVGLPVDGGMGM